ncbi:unnamed protein product [Zymoseptoria tritici ST99CH_1A5]|uniref:F-box domain-containing protein n=3 Tax=Zymoseptoria tritici TaxID=1047171 RepID=F9XLF7_ZYMTI|nr:uncharacterized protein MYCGRDRAFT_96279 [Zymoseptoria tritici IPO323]EGP84072.1 hypothetical protein MYCGRDRAFT_96279 [Zymoseptoria tritici IPO323]SMR59209.1 unnamed protein product [Zymoseptoria tritici ST99CH_1E4]SMY28419.1 unnamed protein product [Zymoseptoria tritici ST99CH_1A5]
MAMDDLPKFFAEALALEEGRASPPQEHSALIDLPVELNSAILSRLSVAQIQRCRLVCHHLKALVDETTNHGTLLGPGTIRQTQRIESCMDKLLHFPVKGTDAFLNALISFCNHRGLHRECPSGRRFTEVIAFVSSWETESAGGIRIKKPLSNEDRENRLGYLNYARAIIDVHILHHVPQMIERQNHGILDFGSFLTQLSHRPGPGVQPSTDSACWALYTQLESTPGGSFVNSPIYKTEVQGLPDWYLTPLDSHPIADCREILKRKHLPFTTAGEVARVFDLSSFEADGFAFCVKTKWAHGRLWEVLKGMKALGPVEKLAILEDLFFF